MRFNSVLIPAAVVTSAVVFNMSLLSVVAGHRRSWCGCVSAFQGSASYRRTSLSSTNRFHFTAHAHGGMASPDTSITSTTVASYWNRETSPRRQYSVSAPIVQPAKILAIADPNDPANAMLYNPEALPAGAELVKIVTSVQDLMRIAAATTTTDHDESAAAGGTTTDASHVVNQLRALEVNTIFVSHPAAREPLAFLLQHMSESIKWIHLRSAGMDAYTSPTLEQWKDGVVTNAKGQFSSTLAEYTLMACSYFAKDLPRLLRNKQDKQWDKYPVLELRGATLGIVGYGDIGQAAAKLANVYGMKIIALRRRRRGQPQEQEQRDASTSPDDPYCHAVYTNDDAKTSLNRIFAESDYILCSAPLTPETRGMIGAEQFGCAKKDAVFINVGRGPIVDEPALIEALQMGQLKGAALDVFQVEPLPESSPLWELDNVLLSPHNMDQTATFMHEATEFFVQENLPRFLRGDPLLNQVNPAAGY